MKDTAKADEIFEILKGLVDGARGLVNSEFEDATTLIGLYALMDHLSR